MNPERMSYYDHRMIRQALPTPKLFGLDFINTELDKLADMRSQARNTPKQVSLQ